MPLNHQPCRCPPDLPPCVLADLSNCRSRRLGDASRGGDHNQREDSPGPGGNGAAVSRTASQEAAPPPLLRDRRSCGVPSLLESTSGDGAWRWQYHDEESRIGKRLEIDNHRIVTAQSATLEVWCRQDFRCEMSIGREMQAGMTVRRALRRVPGRRSRPAGTWSRPALPPRLVTARVPCRPALRRPRWSRW
jgi:hypothetical protein